MTNKKETPEEKAQRLTLQGQLLHEKLIFHTAVACMKTGPHVVALVKRCLQSNGLWNAGVDTAKTAARKRMETPLCSEQAPAGDTADENLTEQQLKEKEFKENPDLQAEIHRNFARWRDVPPKHLKSLCAALEPVSCNARVLKVYCSTGQREVPREPLLQILEFMLDVDPNTEVGPARMLWEIAMWMWDRSFARGRAAQMITHPADYAGALAIYGLRKWGHAIAIRHKAGEAETAEENASACR